MNKQLFCYFMAKNNDTQKSLATALDVNVATINHKINGKAFFYLDELQVIVARWNLCACDVFDIFLVQNVAKCLFCDF